MTAAFKFLRPGRVAPFAAITWPEAGTWLESPGEPELCGAGVHALRASALPLWLGEELWRVELEGEREAGDGLVVARRGRLIAHVADWDDQAARDFADACLAALPHGSSDPIVRERSADAVDAAGEVTAGLTAAAVAYISAKAAEADRPDGYWQERERQAAWLSRRLAL